MKKIKVLTGLVALCFMIMLLPELKAEAAGAPKVAVKLLEDKVTPDDDIMETITYRIKNNSDQNLTVLAYGVGTFYDDESGEGGIMSYRTQSGKNVTIKPGKSKKVTMITHQGWVSMHVPAKGDSFTRSELYYKYNGKRYYGSYNAVDGVGKKLKADGGITEITDDTYAVVKDWWS